MKKKVHIPVLLKRNRDFLVTVYEKTPQSCQLWNPRRSQPVYQFS